MYNPSIDSLHREVNMSISATHISVATILVAAVLYAIAGMIAHKFATRRKR